ncbi:MAG: HD domain-containing protein, partial [Treponema sp.]|nr:HD domain-containing protein [Treponema sp.]
HSQAYRRLKHKTQVFFAPKNDHICTRMEHVNHVASVSETIAKYLGLNTELTQAIAIGHDIGHAPFGHHGEDCLNNLLIQKEGENAPKKFWHERNSLFFADYIETLQDPYGIERPLNLTYAVRDGLICHCGEIDQIQTKPRDEAIDLYSIKKAGFTQPYTWEGCVVKIADKIAYLGRDLEDARTYHILDMSAYRELREIVTGTLGYNKSKSKRAVNTTVIINDLISDICNQSSPEKGLCFSDKYFNFITELKKFNVKRIYNHWKLVEFQKYATNVINTIYNFLTRTFPYAKSGRIALCLKYHPELQKSFEDWLIRYSNYKVEGNPDKKRLMHYDTIPIFDCTNPESYNKCIIEYISGMTDHYAMNIFDEIISF